MLKVRQYKERTQELRELQVPKENMTNDRQRKDYRKSKGYEQRGIGRRAKETSWNMG